MNQGLDLVGRARPAAVLVGAALLTLCSTGAPARADTANPQLSIAVDNGSQAVKSGDQLGYTVTITNLGSKKIKDLRVSQTIPSGASFVSADSHGRQARGSVGWSVDVGAAEKITVHTTLALGTTPGSALRLATVACAQVSAKGPALVCASDSDQLPAGAAVERAEADAVPAAGGWLDGRTPWYVGGGAGLALVALGAVLLVRRSRHPVVGPAAVAPGGPPR